MASINVVYRPSQKKGRHPGSLSLRLIHDRQVKTITLKGCRIYDEEWDKDIKTVLTSSGKPGRAAYLEDVASRINDEVEAIESFILLLESKGRYSLGDLLGLYQRQHDQSTLLGYVENLVTIMQARGQDRTARAYMTVTHGLMSFNGNTNIPLIKINSCLIKDFESHLKEKGRLPNTISYYMRNLRAIYNKAVKDKLILPQKTDHPFAGVFTGNVKTAKRALSLDETRNLLDVDFEALLRGTLPGSREYDYLKSLSQAQRYFSFCLYARGMCFVDLAYLKKANIKNGTIRYIRKKTGQQIEMQIIPLMQSIIDSFAAETADSPYVFPIIRDTDKPALMQYENALRTQNNRLKRLATLAGIDRTISTHQARHTWATVGKLINLPTTVIGEGLGHTSESTTTIYLALLNNSILDDANRRIALTIQRHRMAGRLSPM